MSKIFRENLRRQRKIQLSRCCRLLNYLLNSNGARAPQQTEIERMQIIEITHKMLIPDGYEFDRYWYPKGGETYINPCGEVMVASVCFATLKYHIIKRR